MLEIMSELDFQLTSSEWRDCQDRVESARTAPVIGNAAAAAVDGAGMRLLQQKSALQLDSQGLSSEQWSTDRGQCRIKVDWHDRSSVHVKWTLHN